MMREQVTVARAKHLRAIGFLTGAGLESVPGAGWSVWVSGGSSYRAEVADARERAVRHFRTLDAAVACLRQVGYSVDGLQVC